MRTGFVSANANKPLTKTFYYHGVLTGCTEVPNPTPFWIEGMVPGIYVVLTFDYHNVTSSSADLEGVLIFIEGIAKCTTRGFLYGLTEMYTDEVHENGSFAAGNYILPITF